MTSKPNQPPGEAITFAHTNCRNFNSGAAKHGHGLSCHARKLSQFAGWHKCSVGQQLSAMELKGRSIPRAPLLSCRSILLFPRKHIFSASQEKVTFYPQSVVDLLVNSKKMSLG